MNFDYFRCMNLKELNKFTLACLGVGILLLIYGYVAPAIEMNFFWESKSIGWYIFLVGVVGLLSFGIKSREKRKKKAVLNVIGIVMICFVLLVQTILAIAIPSSDAYAVSKEFALGNEYIIEEVGVVNGFGFLPTGGISIQSDQNGTTGSANISLLVKGEKSYKIYNVIVVKPNNSDWEVIEYE